MINTNPFAEEMARLADIELIDIVTMRRADFLPDALAAADAEIVRRGISIRQIETYQAASILYRGQQVMEDARPLPLEFIILAFFLPLYSLPFFLYVSPVGRYKRRKRECMLWTFCGCCFYFLIITVRAFFFS